ncbi:MAG TPA: GNAT family N-acetyltransferase [Albitalea sp.]
MKVVPADGYGAQALSTCFSAAFEGYIAGSMVMAAADLTRFLDRQGADLGLSRCVVDDDGELLGLCFVGAFDGRRRIGGMGMLPRARGSGAAGLLLRRVIGEARSAGCSALELEVFAQNTPAVRLYRSHGFVEIAPLWGYERVAGAPVAAGTVPKRIGRRRAGGWLLARGRADLPYQVSGHALAHADPSATLWRIGRAVMLFSEVAPGRLMIGLLNDLDPAQHDASRLLAALIEAHPGHTIKVPQLMRDEVAGAALRAMGFVPMALHQLQMRLALDDVPGSRLSPG